MAEADELRDDVSLLPEQGSRRQIITTDTLVEGVHFLSDDPLETVGQKLVRVNVSDILAKGALPTAALFNLTWPKGRSEEDLRSLIAGLGQSIPSQFSLIGGDTTSTNGPMVLSLTLIGECLGAGPVRRSGASVGDDIWVTGTIGDAYLGLKVRLGELASDEALVRAYHIPQIPDFLIARCVSEFANASVDVSDGLLADIGHIAEVSGLRAELVQDDVPLSEAARRILTNDATNIGMIDLLGGGDDYQTLFTAAVGKRVDIETFGAENGLKMTRIGRMVEGTGVALFDPSGNPVNFLTTGWQH